MSNTRSNRGLAFVYAATIFVSAFLLFQIQPMISKAILPWFGGTPAVWTICLLFFQTILFAGYAYAHFTNRLRPRQQAVLHVLVLTAALALIAWTRVVPGSNWQPRGDADPTRAILVILAITIGLPYFVLSATGPLLQAWFARSFPGRTPYRLYALSNIGSLLALLGYPFLFERQFDLSQQASIWMIGFIAFAVLCALAAWRVSASEPSPSVGQAVPDNSQTGVQAEPSPQPEAVAGLETPPDPLQQDSTARPHYFLWLLLPAFASIVLMATTNHISTDVAVVPLLWVVPLALYLLTFIIAFDRPAWYWPTLTAVLTLLAIYPTTAISKKHNVGKLNLYDCAMTGHCAKMVADFFTKERDPAEITDGEADLPEPTGPQFSIDFRFALFVNFAAMFGICLLCHGQLARLKPPTEYLTAYYLMIAAGGALGGIAVSIIAPHVFSTILEWKIAIFAAAIGTVAVILSAIVSRVVEAEPDASQPPRESRPSLLPRFVLIALLAPIALMMLDMVDYLFGQTKDSVYQSRNFFGALTIRADNADDPHAHEYLLLNGTTIHGSQFAAPERRPMPTSYYGKFSGVGLVLDYFHENRPPGGVRIGDVGLGAGTLAAYALKFDHIVFYEINPTVVDIATSGQWFTYISDARARGAFCDIRLGDARLTLQRELDDAKRLPYHVLVLDAFSGDAVPTHLLTAEAMEIYLPHVATEANMGVDGALLIHVSNRYLELERVALGAAKHIGFEAVQIHSPSVDEKSINSADWVILTRNKGLLAALAEHPNAVKPSPDDKPPVLWTDDHSSLFEIIR